MRRVFCESSGALVPKDKAVKRFIVRNIVESAAIRDLQEACVYEAYQLPKLYRKVRSATRLLTTPRFVPLRCRGAARGLASKPQLQAGCSYWAGGAWVRCWARSGTASNGSHEEGLVHAPRHRGQMRCWVQSRGQCGDTGVFT